MNPRHRAALAALALAAVAFACGDRLIRDPSFELWCGKKLCKPWESEGEIRRVGTWHRNDYGIELGDGAQISQRVEHAPVKCIELELIADVSAQAEVKLELDFMDDGTVEHSEPIAESHWALLHYLVRAPSWYDGVRFRVRKEGKGRAVLAQLAANESSDCEGEPIALDDRPGGARCDDDAQCAGGVCALIPQRTMIEGEPPANDAQVCGGCREDADCASGQACGVLESKWGPYRQCVDAGSAELGAFCESEAACASGLCAHGLPFNNATCSECERDSDCGEGELCGLQVLAGGAARVCQAQTALELGALCGENAQCGSGVCCFGACSECCGDFIPCADGSACGMRPDGTTSPVQLCGAGLRDRSAGEPCAMPSDCAAAACDVPASECLLEGDRDSDDFWQAICRISEQLAGTCR